MEKKVYRRLAILVCGLASYVLQFPTLAAPGDLDLTFGNGGKVITSLGGGISRAASLAVQKDGKLVAAGYCPNSGFDFAVVRYNTDGSLDTSFGNGGTVTTPVGSGDDRGQSVAIQGDGKIVVAGSCRKANGDFDFALVRYNADGTLDMSFGSGGKVTTDIRNARDQAMEVVVQEDGKIVVAGYTLGSDTNIDFALVRYDANGNLDTSFGSGGKVITPAVGFIYDSNDYGTCVAVQRDGKIIVGGHASGGFALNFALARYNADGTLDKSFGRGGAVTTNFGPARDTCNSLTVQGDGKIVAVGSDDSGIALARYNSDGSLDTSFSEDGMVMTSIGSSTASGSSVKVQHDGRIVVAGSCDVEGKQNFALVRYNTDGSLDATFSGDGKVTTQIGDGESFAASVAVQVDGRIVVAGYSNFGGFALARYEGIPTAPVVTTGPVIWTTTTSAHLSGTVNPDGLSATVLFETARLDEPYEVSGNVTAHQSPVEGSGTQSVSGTRTGLLPHTTYKFRVSATSSAGTSVGEDVTFTTANSQPVANNRTINPDGIGQTQVIFSPITNASDADGDPLTVKVLSYTGTGIVDVLDGVVVYTGGPLDGSEFVKVEVSDAFGGSAQATIQLRNAAPEPAPDTVVGYYGRHSNISVLENDRDPNGHVLSVVSFTQPSNGEVIRADGVPGVLVYTPRLGFSGQDTFTYSVTDGRSAPVTETATITVGLRQETQISVALNTGAMVPGPGGEGTGIPAGATWRNFGTPTISDAGHVAVLGSWKSSEGSGSGIFVDEQLVVKAGDPVPGIVSATFKSFKDPLINRAGRVAFLATISGPGVRKGNDTVLVSDAFAGELEIVAREGDVAPETDDARFVKFYSISLRSDLDSTGLLFTASLLNGSGKPKVTQANDLGAWLRTPSLGATPCKVMREGDPGFAEGEKIKSFQLLHSLSGSPGQDRGHYAVDKAKFLVTLSKRQALAHFREGALEAEEFTGQPAGGGLYWKSFGVPATGSYGEDSAIRAVLQLGPEGGKGISTAGIFHSLGQGMEFNPVARVGDAAFGVTGAVFSGFKDPLASSWYSAVAFQATIKGQGVRANNNNGIWWANYRGWRLVARTGSQAAEAPEGAVWKSFTSLAMPDLERGPLFVATLARGAGSVDANNDTGLWAMDSVGEVRLLARERGPVGEKTLKSFSALEAVSGAAGARRSFNDGGQVVYRAYFTDGSQGLVKVQVP